MGAAREGFGKIVVKFPAIAIGNNNVVVVHIQCAEIALMMPKLLRTSACQVR